MRFILQMARREIRASWRRLAFFFLCIAIGVGAIVALRSAIQTIRGALTGEARSLLAADVVISTNRPWEPRALETIRERLAAAPIRVRTEEVQTVTMMRPLDPTKPTAKVVEVRAVAREFPLYGTVQLASGRPYVYSMLVDQGALVRPEVLVQLGVAVGDRIVLGRGTFTIRDVVTAEPGQPPGAFSFGPRVVIARDHLPATGLLDFGSRARHAILLKVDDAGVDPLVEQLRRDFSQQFVSARSYRTTEDQIGTELSRAENYLSLVGLVIVILGGIGVSSVIRVFVQQKLKSIAVLKCIGASSRQILTVYVLQVLLLGFAGSAVGIVIARVALAAVRPTLERLAVNISYGLTLPAVLQGIGVGVLVSLLFSLVPLLEVRYIKPSLLLRDAAAAKRRLDGSTLTTIAAAGIGLAALASWQAASVRIGVVLCLGLVAVAIALQLAGIGVLWVLRPLARSRSFPVRHAVRRLSRPGNQTRTVLLAVGLGAFVIIAVHALQEGLLRDFRFTTRPDAADMFLIDVQRDQADPVRRFVLQATGADPESAQMIPVMRARVTGVRGRDVTLENYDDVRSRGGGLGREFTITYRQALAANERVIRGRLWPPTPSAAPEVSIERSLHERFRIDVGDEVRFDVLGRIVSARVTSIRAVEWEDARSGGFMFIFRPGALDAAPHTYIAPVKGPSDPARRARFQRELADAFPNVSVIDVLAILQTARKILDTVTLGITVVGGIVLFSGALILIGSISMTKYQRVYEAAVLKTIGSSTRLIVRLLLFEYGLLGFVAGTVGSLGAIALTWGLSRYALDIPWYPAISENVIGIVLTTLLVATVGVVASVDVLRRKPLATLRAE
jgi:putative ABC transport system permease protein